MRPTGAANAPLSGDISSPAWPPNAQQFGHAVRNHWGIENRLHWVLDISFREDECRIRCGDGAEILGVVRHFVLDLLRQDKTSKRGIEGKRYKAALDIHYAARVLEPILV